MNPWVLWFSFVFAAQHLNPLSMLENRTESIQHPTDPSKVQGARYSLSVTLGSWDT